MSVRKRLSLTGERLEVMRMQLQLRHGELARLLDMTPQYLSDIKWGRIAEPGGKFQLKLRDNLPDWEKFIMRETDEAPEAGSAPQSSVAPLRRLEDPEDWQSDKLRMLERQVGMLSIQLERCNEIVLSQIRLIERLTRDREDRRNPHFERSAHQDQEENKKSQAVA